MTDQPNQEASIVEEKKDIKTSKFSLKPEEVQQKTQPSAVITGDIKEIGLTRIDPMEIEKYLLMHPVVPRGIEIKANRIIKLGFDIIPFDDSKESKEAALYCNEILQNSDKKPEIFLKRFIEAAYGFGNGYCVLIPNESNNKIMKFELQHSIFFGPAKYPENYLDKELAGKMKIEPRTKKIISYTQLRKPKLQATTYDNKNLANVQVVKSQSLGGENRSGLMKKDSLEPFGEEIVESFVGHLLFDRLGDEVLGISLVQYVHRTIMHLLNIEEAGAQTLYNFGFHKYVTTTPFKTKKELTSLGQDLAGVKNSSNTILPADVNMNTIQPGATQFPEYHERFLTLLAIRLGIPKAILLQDSESTNKSTVDIQMEFTFGDLFADELILEGTIDDMFEKACELNYGSGFKKFPKLKFRPRKEDKDTIVERDVRQSIIVRNYTRALEILKDIQTPEGQDAMKALLQDLPVRLGIRSMRDDEGRKRNAVQNESSTDETPVLEVK